jgi:monoterpene epsilon-lactone hydrolase
MSIQLFLADKLVRLTVKRRFARNPDVMTLRALMEETRPAKVPPGITLEASALGGVASETLTAANAVQGRAILYLHGGGFVGGSPRTHRALTWRLAKGCAASVHVPDYRLAPEFPFPAGLDDCLAAYRALLAKAILPSHIAVGGDSAGGNLTLALALKIKSLGLPQPAALFCLSPATDLAGGLGSHRTNRRTDAMFVPEMFPSVTRHYCPGADPGQPLISPLRGDVAGLPATLIQCSGAEMLRDDGVLMAEKLKAAGISVELEVWPKVFHVWQIAADLLPESRRAIANIVSFVSRQWGDPVARP